ncbi:methyltransferase domain-containing protein [Azorhizophilus paspali]|uniref:Methyltransferase domain-containing protein n=1 Tax=Azorhizophilus paspali TaxID=69963 RepID=A0ABV6SPL3_AZOPA
MHDVEEVSEGVFKLRDKNVGPDVIEYDGGRLYRFMDGFYVRREHLDEMSPAEVSSLCRARLGVPQSINPVNKEVKENFRLLTRRLGARNILEIGAGRHPLFESAPTGTFYALADADEEVRGGLTEPNEFNEFSESAPDLKYRDGQFDLIVAVFVFQFPFYPAQISEVARCLAQDGVLVANVYRRRIESRIILKEQFLSSGLNVKSISDPKKLCRDHEYWVIGRTQENIDECVKLLLELIG